MSAGSRVEKLVKVKMAVDHDPPRLVAGLAKRRPDVVPAWPSALVPIDALPSGGTLDPAYFGLTRWSHSCGLVGGPASLSPHQHSFPYCNPA